MTEGLLDRPLPEVATALRQGATSARDLLETALARHDARRPALGAYIQVDREGARRAAEAADRRLSADRVTAPPLCGIPVSVKDLYGVTGQPVWAGTARPLPDRWARDGWLVGRLRAQGAVFTGRTHTVELAFGAVGVNLHHGTPRHPRDDVVHRIPGGSSSGAAASLVEGSALLALGTDTGGSIRIPASLAGVVGHKPTHGRWSTDGVVPLSPTLDTVGALSRSVVDAAWFFGAVDPSEGDPDAFLARLRRRRGPLRIGWPRSAIGSACQPDIADGIDAALQALCEAGLGSRIEVDGTILDEAAAWYAEGVVVAAECREMLDRELPELRDRLDLRVATRLEGAVALDEPAYLEARTKMGALARRGATLFDDVDVLAWPTHLHTPPPVAEVADLQRYLAVNRDLLRPTCPVEHPRVLRCDPTGGPGRGGASGGAAVGGSGGRRRAPAGRGASGGAAAGGDRRSLPRGPLTVRRTPRHRSGRSPPRPGAL